ncbi:MAG: hypothetical protein JNJ83_17730 [Verrucomicrobiaceae bacterium]|nr:hypothetical protein [Verrucomicrobiaceae bacterium]
MRYFTNFLLAAMLTSAASAQFGYGPSEPGQVVSMDQGGNMNSQPQNYNQYGTANYNGYGGGPGVAPIAPQPTLGTTSGLGRGGSMLTYGLLEGFYRYTTFETEGLDGAHGVGISLSAELFRPFYVRGGFDWGTGNGSALGKGQSYDFNTISIGGGAYFAVSDKFHLFAEVGGMYTNLNATKSSLNFSDGAVYITPGLRFAATESLELDLSVTATSADEYDSRVVDLSGYYKLFSSMDVGLGTGFGNETRSFFAGVRFRW